MRRVSKKAPFLCIMDFVVFQTDSGNCYLFSPSVKSLIPIPQSVYNDVSIFGMSNNPVWLTLQDGGYLQPYINPFCGNIDALSIETALRNLSQIVFETTTVCNLKCEYCCYGEGYNTFDSRRKQKGHLSFDVAKAIIDFFLNIFEGDNPSNAPEEPFAISFYGGEPLMNFPVVKDIVEYAEKQIFRNRKLSFTMTTNAMLLGKYAEFLQKHDFKLLISIDGNKKHDVYRKTTQGKESFDNVMSNLQRIKNLYPDWFNSFRYNVVYTNISDVKEIITWFKETFDKYPNFSPLHSPTKGSKDYEKIKNMVSRFEIPEEYKFDEELMAQSPINKRVFEFCNRLFQKTVNNEVDLLNDIKDLPTGTCVPFSKRVFISYDGKIHPCEKVNRDFPLGEVINTGNVIIDNERVAKEYMSKVTSIRSTCQKCYLQMCCTKCMLCFDGGVCSDFVSKKQFILLLSQTVSYIENHPNVISLLEKNIVIK